MSILVYNGLDKRPVPTEEINSGEQLVETAGYIPADRQIEDMIYAGQRLNLARAEMFDFPTGEDDGVTFDPTRSRNFDLADASRIGMETAARLKKQAADKKAQDDDAAAEAAKAAKEKEKKDWLAEQKKLDDKPVKA